MTIDHVVADGRIEALGFATATVSGTDPRAVLASLRLPAAGGRSG